MNRIEKIFVDTGDMKMQNNHFLVKTGIGLPPVTGLVNRQFKLIIKLNPVNQENVALYYDAWEFFRRPNRELNRARVMEGYFTAAAVTSRCQVHRNFSWSRNTSIPMSKYRRIH